MLQHFSNRVLKYSKHLINIFNIFNVKCFTVGRHLYIKPSNNCKQLSYHYHGYAFTKPVRPLGNFVFRARDVHYVVHAVYHQYDTDAVFLHVATGRFA